MNYLKARILAILLILIGGFLTYINWHQLSQDHTYNMKLAAFAPVCVVGGLFLFIFPAMGGKPNTTRQKIIVLVVLAIGLIAGLVNWFLMDPAFFGR